VSDATIIAHHGSHGQSSHPSMERGRTGARMTPTCQLRMWHGCRCVRYHGA